MTEEGIIKNQAPLASSAARRQALEILEAGVAAVLPARLISRALAFDRAGRTLSIMGREHRLEGRIFVLGAGKSSGAMAEALEGLIGADLISAGLVVDKADPRDFKTSSICIKQAGHPLPDQRGVAAANEILNLKADYSIGAGDTLLCLISGGGSALLPAPAEGVSLEDKLGATRLLLSCGADIQEINTVRKHLSQLKGGRLAAHFAPARIISLIISDVVGDELSVIASGPTYPDNSTFQDALAILGKYHLLDRVPRNVLSVLEAGQRGRVAETPKTLDNALNYILADNLTALQAMAREASRLELTSRIVTARQTGETEAVARMRAEEVLCGRYSAFEVVLLGGETTPVLPARPGKGGRNQHMAASIPLWLADYQGDWVFASLGTDGSDYLPEAAGAIVDQGTLAAYRRLRPDYSERLKNYDSYRLLKTLPDSLIVTGDTHTNVGDIMLFLFPPRPS
jgi:glycerate 2-kinase